MLSDKVFYVPKDAEITPALVKEAIEFNESLIKRYEDLENYYLGKHEILNRKRPSTIINNKIVANHCKYITDVNVGYLLGNPVKYNVRDDVDMSLIEDEYRKQTISDLDHEIAKDLSIYGRQYEYVYVGEGNQVKSVEVNVRNCIVAYDDTFEHNKMFAVLYKKLDRTHYETITVLTDKEEINFLVGEAIAQGESTQHKLDMVPIIEYRNNDEYMGDYEQVTSLVDSYNLLQSDRVNDKEQLVSAIMIFKNLKLTEKQREDLKTTRTLSDVPLDAEVSFLTKELNEAQLDILRQNLIDDIHKISMTPNLSDENFVGNSSGVAIRYKLLAFEQSVKNKERSMEKGLIERFVIYNQYLSKLKGMPIINHYDVDVIFTRNLPQNDYETSQMINNLVGLGLPYEVLLQQLSFIPNAKEAMKQAKKERTEMAKQDLPEYGKNEPTKAPEEDTDNDVAEE